jgi:hypothetical protein
MSTRIRIGQLRLAIPGTRAAAAAAPALAKSVAAQLGAQLAAALADVPDAERRTLRSLRVRLPRARSSAADIARAIRKSLEEG